MSRALLVGVFLWFASRADAQPRGTPPSDPGKPAEPKPESGLPETPGRADISAAISKVKPKMMACGQQYNVKGTVKIAVKINPDGTVKSAEIKQTPDDKINGCIVGVAKTITLPKSNNGVTFSYPIVL